LPRPARFHLHRRFGLHVAIGTDFPALSASLDRNLREGRVAILQAVLDRP